MIFERWGGKREIVRDLEKMCGFGVESFRRDRKLGGIGGVCDYVVWRSWVLMMLEIFVFGVDFGRGISINIWLFRIWKMIISYF